MNRLALLPMFVCTMVGTLTWALAKYAEVRGEWRLQSQFQPRGRPVLSRPLV